MSAVTGETKGLKASQRHALERTQRRRVPPAELVTNELVHHLLEVSEDIGRRVGVLVNRRGQITEVVVGSAKRIYLPDLGRARGGQRRLRGLRWIQTQLHAEGLSQDDLTDLGKLRLDYLLSVAPSDKGTRFFGAHLIADAAGALANVQEASSIEQLGIADFSEFVQTLESELLAAGPRVREAAGGENRALIVSVGSDRRRLRARLAEVKELCATAGVTVADSVEQVRSELDARYLVGQGKLEEIVLQALDLGAELLVFDRELSPTQSRTIANSTELKVIDRTQLILDIFAQHARSSDGKVQVELAQLKYNLPRLSEMSTAMSRLTGGIGGRGPGETKLEINRRRAKARIGDLEKQIEALSIERDTRRRRRQKQGLPVIAIVGYTNAGKSTLLNALTRSQVLVENQLFATLDPTSRRLRVPNEREVLLTDTVGFISDLPPDLVNAFRATLEELSAAIILLHVIDASDPRAEEKRRAVEGILEELELADRRTLRVWNKCDAASPAQLAKLRFGADDMKISAARREGLNALVLRVQELLGPLGRLGHERAPAASEVS